MDELSHSEWERMWREDGKVPTVIYLYADRYKALADYITSRYGLEPTEYKIPQVKELPGRCVLTLSLGVGAMS